MTSSAAVAAAGAIITLAFTAAGALGSAGDSEAGAGPPLGPFAGYVWRGRVTSVRASWRVPIIAAGSRNGHAGTWVGAQAPGTPVPFIQVGTNEERLSPVAGLQPFDDYYAFWSDTARSFHPQLLFAVKPGDEISAGLTRTHTGWMVSIRDLTSGSARRFPTGQEARASFDEVEWTEEDITDGLTHRPFPYPQLSTVRFRQLAVNSVRPAYAAVYSTWMSLSAGALAPSALRGDAFALQHTRLDGAGVRYLRMVTPANVALGTFAVQLARWTASTPRSVIVSASSTYAAALDALDREQAHARWPLRARRLIGLEIANARVIVDRLKSARRIPAGAVARWRSALLHVQAKQGRLGHETRRALHVPELIPVT